VTPCILAAALQLVFPCRSGKRPANKHGRNETATEADVIEYLWRR
jgi:hypothetical protein